MSQPEQKFVCKTVKEQYRETLEMVQLDKSQTELEIEVKLEQIKEMQAEAEELKSKAADLAATERSLQKLLGDEVEEEEKVELAPAPQPIYVPIYPNPIPAPQPYDPNTGGIWTSPYTVPYTSPNTTPSNPWGGSRIGDGSWGGIVPNRPTITFENQNVQDDGHYVSYATNNAQNRPVGSSFVITSAEVSDAMIAGHMSFTSSGSQCFGRA